MKIFFRLKYLLFCVSLLLIFCVSFIIYLKAFTDFRLEKQRLTRILKNSPRFYFDHFGEDITINNNGLKLRGTIYNNKSQEKLPCIILLHGASPYGRHLALYRILGKELADKGYLTLCFDFRGFNDSEDPKMYDEKLFDFYEDVSSVLDYVVQNVNIDTSKIYIVGHSHGGNVAFVFGSYDCRIKKIVSIGPSRRVKELVLPEIEDKINSRTMFFSSDDFRISHDMKLKGNIPVDLVKNLILSTLIDNHSQYYQKPCHKPLLLIDGELEDYRDRLFLKDFYRQLTPPCDYISLQNVAHYHNTINWLGTSFVVYDNNAVFELVQLIDSWLTQS